MDRGRKAGREGGREVSTSRAKGGPKPETEKHFAVQGVWCRVYGFANCESGLAVSESGGRG